MTDRNADMRHILSQVQMLTGGTASDRLAEARVQVWSGATINVYRNPSPTAFRNLIGQVEVLRGLLSPDGNDVFLWDAYMAVHPNIMQELALGDYDCISYNRGRWNGPVGDAMSDQYKPAIERLTPKPKSSRAENDRLLKAIFDDPEFAAMMGEGARARGKPKMRPDAQDIAKIREIRTEIRIGEGGGGMCHFVSEVIRNTWGWDQAGGTVTRPNGDVMIVSHRWNILPDGAILDATFDQMGQGRDIAIIPKSDPLYACYRLEWDIDYNPGRADEYPELRDHPQWTGELDMEHANRLRDARGRDWYVTDKKQHGEYLKQQKRHEKGKP